MTKGISIQGKTILITGANRGIGKSIAEELIAQGAKKVYAAVRDLKSASDLSETHGDKLVPILIDLEKPETIEEAAKQASDVEIVINNAGVLKTASPLDPEAVKAIQFEFNVNVLGLIRMAQAFAPILKANGGGAFVQLNSVASLRSSPTFSTYSASKAASFSITQSLHDQLAEQGTLVVSVHPGPIDTEMAKQAGLSSQASPPNVVATSIIEALAKGEYLVFPDEYAKQLGKSYRSFANEIIES